MGLSETIGFRIIPILHLLFASKLKDALHNWALFMMQTEIVIRNVVVLLELYFFLSHEVDLSTFNLFVRDTHPNDVFFYCLELTLFEL